jgi:hypothetical protein
LNLDTSTQRDSARSRALECRIQRIVGVKRLIVLSQLSTHCFVFLSPVRVDGVLIHSKAGLAVARTAQPFARAGKWPARFPRSSSRTHMKASELERVIQKAVEKALSLSRLSDPRRGLEQYPQRMTVSQVAAFLNCSEAHVVNLYDEGKLEGNDISIIPSRRTLRFFRESVARYDQSLNEAKTEKKFNR